MTDRITIFSFWHFAYIFVIAAMTVGLSFLVYHLKEDKKHIPIKIVGYSLFTLYLIDFFVEFALYRYGVWEVNTIIYKLPFHFCTFCAPFIVVVQTFEKLKPLREQAAMLGIVSAASYLVLPGTSLDELFYGYVVIQTMVYHGLLLAWGITAIVGGYAKIDIKHCWRSLLTICAVVAWAWLGIAIFDKGEGTFDWAFLLGQSFTFIPPKIMTLVVIGFVFGLHMVLYGLIYLIVYLKAGLRPKEEGVPTTK